MSRRASLILPLLALPALIGCHQAPKVPSPGAAALAAVAEHPGAPRQALARAIEDLFGDADAGETHALLVLHGGAVVAERYGPGIGRETRLAGGGLSQCVTTALIGLLVADGRLRMDQGVPIPAWQRPGDPRGEITLRQLLQMRSGLRHREEASPAYEGDAARMLFLDGRDDSAAYAEAQPLDAEPGHVWRYSTATGVILGDLVARALGDSRDPAVRRRLVTDYLRTRLLEPLGMRSATAQFDAAGTMLGGSMIHASARDWARLGEFLRNGGSVRGAQVVPREWIRFMAAASPRNPAFGAGLWRNHPGADGAPALVAGRGLGDVVACLGQPGQAVLIVPSQDLTVVRLGQTAPEGDDALRARLAAIVTLYAGD